MRALPPPPMPKASGVRAGGVLEHHDGVVHYPAYGYGEPCERDDVASPVYLKTLNFSIIELDRARLSRAQDLGRRRPGTI
jgi:hypothetical protein